MPSPFFPYCHIKKYDIAMTKGKIIPLKEDGKF